VSVRLLTFPVLCVQIRDDRALPRPGSPIRKSAGQRLFSASPRLIAAVHVLHRLLVPRHPPYALIILTEEHHISTMQISRCVRNTCPTAERPHHRRGLSKLNSVRRVCTFAPTRCQVDMTSRLPITDGKATLKVVTSSALMIGSCGVGHRIIPRKEVIQPHLPVRLPCYDFTPITEPTFDGSLPCGLGHRLRVFPTFVV
jgi:hypothetical protein